DWLQPTTDTVTYSDGTSDEVYGYDIPLDAVDTDFQLAILGTKGTWYDHTVSVRNAEPKTEDAAAETAAVPADGSYTCAVTLEGGSGRATVESPAALTVADGTMTAVIVWSSPNYDYMLIDGEKYLPTNTEGNSTFEIPVAALDTALAVTADTVAMSTPHEIDYTLTFDSATLTPAE
ncbi:MAG: iron transporter, partial [Gemmiger qucibialis]